MAQRQTPDDDDQLLDSPTDDTEPEPPEDEPEEEDEPEPEEEDEDGEAPEGEGEGATVIAWEDDEDEPGEGDSSVIRKVRERNKALARENAELRKVASAAAPAEAELEPEPTMEDCAYNEDEFKQRWTAWSKKKDKADAVKTQQEAAAEQVRREWQEDLSRYEAKRTALSVDDFDEVTEPVKARLSLAQQSVIVKVANDPAAFAYALGGSDTRLAELAKIQDPFKLAAAVARMEGGVRVTKRRKGPPPDRPARGTARIAGVAPDKVLAKLEEEAERTGDRTKIAEHKRKLAAAGKKGK